jgi:hypothetical protein
MKYTAHRSTFWEPENLVRTSWRAYETQMWVVVQERGWGVASGAAVSGARPRDARAAK